MLTKNEKNRISLVGILLILVAFIAFFYEANFIHIGQIVGTIYPYRDYAMPAGIVGVAIMIVGLALPLRKESKEVEMKTGTPFLIDVLYAVGIVVGILIAIYLIPRGLSP